MSTTKRYTLGPTGVPYGTHGGAFAGCDESKPCARDCWAKAFVARGLHEAWEGLVSRTDPCGTEACENALAFGNCRRHSDLGGDCTRCYLSELRWTGKVWEDPHWRERVERRRKPAVILVGFMGDIALASPGFIRMAFYTAFEARQHQTVFLTKRPRLLLAKLCHGEQMVEWGGVLWEAMPRTIDREFIGNTWLGVSASTQAEYDERVGALCDPKTGYPGNKWLSYEPGLQHINLHGLSVVGGKYGAHSAAYELSWIVAGSADTLAHGAAKFTPDIARSLRDQCAAAGVPYWLKQAAWDEPSYRSGTVVSAPRLDGRQHLEAPPPIAAILKKAGKLT